MVIVLQGLADLLLNTLASLVVGGAQGGLGGGSRNLGPLQPELQPRPLRARDLWPVWLLLALFPLAWLGSLFVR